MNKRDLTFLGAGILAGRATRKKTAPGIGATRQSFVKAPQLKDPYAELSNAEFKLRNAARKLDDKKLLRLHSKLEKVKKEIKEHLDTYYLL